MINKMDENIRKVAEMINKYYEDPKHVNLEFIQKKIKKGK